jgi:hypothetical protein
MHSFPPGLKDALGGIYTVLRKLNNNQEVFEGGSQGMYSAYQGKFDIAINT